MNIRVHLPTTKEGWEMLSERIADIHSEFIINQINNLPCSYERKLQVLEGIRKEIEGGVVYFQHRKSSSLSDYEK